MGDAPRPGVRDAREAAGLSQVELAARVGLSRQALGAIEAGRSVPGVDVALRLARALGRDVERLFGGADGAPEPPVEVEVVGRSSSERFALAQVGARWVGLALEGDGLRTSADALRVEGRGQRAAVSLLAPLAEARDNLALMGCATGLGVLADRLHARRGAGRFLWHPSSSGRALRALGRGLTHVAGVHGATDGLRRDPNVAAVRRHAGGEPLLLVTLARWEAGLLTRPGDGEVRGVEDLARPGLRLVAREEGSGARALLERSVREAGLDPELIRSAPVVGPGHLDVARAVALGAADVGVATLDAARALGLRFVPLAEERYDLVLPRSLRDDPRVERLLDALASRPGRRDLEALGYDVSVAGAVVAEVAAA
jgi:putative molybdopterin biosynthesis protein